MTMLAAIDTGVSYFVKRVSELHDSIAEMEAKLYRLERRLDALETNAVSVVSSRRKKKDGDE